MLTGKPTYFQTARQVTACLGATFDCNCFHILIYSATLISALLPLRKFLQTH